jgi:predicted negative regulator of RcsB-dependent stress response
MGRRITRKQLKQDDDFVSAGEIVLRWITDNWRPLIAGLVGVFVVAALWWGVKLWTGARTDEASLMLHRAMRTFEGDQATPGGEPAGDMEAAEQQFREVVDRFGGSDHADMARLYLARIELDRGNREAAQEIFVDISDRHRDDAIGRLANLNLIDFRIASGEGAQVVAELEAVVDGSSSVLPVDAALYKLGELFDREGDPEMAREYYQRLVDEFPESAYLMRARQRLTEIG